MEVLADEEQRLRDEEEEEGFDAVVVGSGYGGSVAAFRMSMGGIKVCLVEKGRRWESQDFATDTFKIISAAKLEIRNSGFSFGPKDALFQVYEQGDSLAAVACGLGGGSLINAGVMMPTPVRVRRNPKWPKEWERDWDGCEGSAAAMLRAQKVPVRFPVAEVMGEIVHREIEDISEDPIKLSINFELEESPSNLMKHQQMDSCLACGNCLAGCPYNAKNSTDKNYILSAIQAGCIVKTECQVHNVVKNSLGSFQEGRTCRTRRRWLVYLNDVDYIAADFVILSAGVFGTTEILFQSQMRGLNLSEALGSGFSCNGNTVAYLAGSPAPLNANGLDKQEIQNKPFQERSGPAISSSYTSSLGFTIQPAVLPTAYPYMLFKGIATYGWPNGYWFFHGILDKLKHVVGFRSSQAMSLNAMGYDESDGKIMFEKGTNKFSFSPPHDPLLPSKIKAFQKLTKKLGGILFMSRYRSTSVHHLGGCNASSNPSDGVCNPNGQVFDPKSPPAGVHLGLYVCDASLIPCSVGTNPSLTIAAAAEHVSRHLVKDVLEYKCKKGIECVPKTVDQHPPATMNKYTRSTPRSTVSFEETLKGYIGGMPCTAFLKLKMNSLRLQDFDQGNSRMRDSQPHLRGKVGGHVVFRAIDKDKLHVIGGEVDLCQVDNRTPYTQYMHYRLLLASSSGLRYTLEGKKIMNPFLFALNAWKETTTLHVTFKNFSGKTSQDEVINLRGELKISMLSLLTSLISLEGNSKKGFVCLLSQTLLRTYLLQRPRGISWDFKLPDSNQKLYPNSTLHKIKTEDGFTISCRQWKGPQTSRVGEKQLNPVLLLNGYAAESFWLPTEPNDFVRTLLEEGHETWLLQPRLHPSNPANEFTIEDVGRFDIPAAIAKIHASHGQSRKVHIVAHCVGGLAFHMALMGGHVSATHIASLTCTNSSMFFKLNAWATFKMWLPLLPVSMAILGKNKILPLLETSKPSSRHQLLMYIACLIPRYERCTCYECEVISGIFGNAFWHQNLSPSMHQWLSKQSTTKLPMAAFPHLRRICKSGFIVDSHGNNSYLIHPERMALSTLYISGGRSLLVTPETSFLANNYMKLHQPGFRHERVVIEGFGHSDLLIGEESYNKVFPHILNHIRLAEQGENVVIISSEKRYNNDALAWEYDSYSGYRGFGIWLSFMNALLLIFLGAVVLITLFR